MLQETYDRQRRKEGGYNSDIGSDGFGPPRSAKTIMSDEQVTSHTLTRRTCLQ